MYMTKCAAIASNSSELTPWYPDENCLGLAKLVEYNGLRFCLKVDHKKQKVAQLRYLKVDLLPLRCIQSPKIPDPQGNIGLTARATIDYKYNS